MIIRGRQLSQHDHREPPKPSFSPDANGGLTLGTLLMLLGITAGALLLRLHNLGQWGVWIDELYTVQHAAELASGWINARSIAYLLSLIGFELAGVDMASVEPLEIWTWRSAGVTEWTIRAPVALLGAATILALALMSRSILGTRPTLWLSLLLALSPWHLWMSQVGASMCSCSCSTTSRCCSTTR